MKQQYYILLLGALVISFNSLAGIIDELRTSPKEKRISKAEDIYEQQVKRLDSSEAFTLLNKILAIGNELNDPSLQSAAYSMMADKLARKYSFNERSTQLHLKAISIASDEKDKLVTGLAEYKLGRYYFSFKKYPQAFEYLLRADNNFKEIGYNNIPPVFRFLYIMGRMYYETGDHDKAEAFFNKCLQYSNQSSNEKIQCYNTIGTMAQEDGDYTKALSNYILVLKEAITSKDDVWKGIASGSIGGIYYMQQQYDKAIPYLTDGYLSNEKFKIWEHATNDAVRLASIFITRNNLAKAETLLHNCNNYLSHLDSVSGIELTYKKNYLEALVQLYSAKGNTNAALTSMQQLQMVKDSIARQKDIIAFNNIQLRIATEEHLAAVARLEEQAKTALLKRNTIIIILVLLMIVSILVYNRTRMKRRTEKQLAEKELNNAKEQLQSFTQNIVEKNELIESFKTELEQLRIALPSGSMTEEQLTNMEQLVHSTILTVKDWDEFRDLFDKVHRGFIYRVKEKIPHLTENELRLLCLSRLKLSRREMANMLGVSQDAVKKSRQRLKKKIELPEESDLDDLICSV